MKTIKNIFSASVALLMITSMGSVYAEEGDISQTRTRAHTRTELNLQAPGSGFGQSRNREEQTVMNQNQYQYKYMNKYQNKERSSGASSINRMNTTNHYMQGSAATDSMNQQDTASRSISRGVIKVF